MLRLPRLALFVALILSTASLSVQSAFALTVGGWNAARGGQAAILDSNGTDFAGVRDDLASFFPAVTVAETAELSTTFLNSIDVLLLDAVFAGNNIPNAPLSAAEQTALTSWVTAGGRALIVADNVEYHATSQSMIHPFGPSWATVNAAGQIGGVVTDHTSFPAITDGPFGVVNTFAGGYASYFDGDPAPATTLGKWLGESSLAALNYGAGKVVFYGDSTVLYGLPGTDNIALRRNTLAYLLGIAPQAHTDYNNNGVNDGADYVVWRKTLGQTGISLAADGNLSQEVDAPDYSLWRATFGESAVIGSGAGIGAAQVPEPSSLALIIAAFGLMSLRRKEPYPPSLAV